ncbi:ferric reductase [Aeromicrobium fastidiosum]|uniref:ferric reductase n=1 Tax=Aeromicrobium fastidiosum TaxID=52699 RepID=UPI0024DF29AF|nr:ferric reductase [Aeromicrobium fastidiosum]
MIWYLARATGMVALIAFTASTAMGALTSRHRARPTERQLDRRFLVQVAHRSAAVLGLTMLLAHAVLIVLDVYVDVSLTSTVVPFTAGYRPLALGLGTLAVYAFVVVAVSGAARGRLATSARATRTWRRVHLAAYAGWAAAMAHGILAGTDTGASWTTAIYATCGLAVAVAVGLRLRDHAAARRAPLASARTLVRSHP